MMRDSKYMIDLKELSVETLISMMKDLDRTNDERFIGYLDDVLKETKEKGYIISIFSSLFYNLKADKQCEFEDWIEDKLILDSDKVGLNTMRGYFEDNNMPAFRDAVDKVLKNEELDIYKDDPDNVGDFDNMIYRYIKEDQSGYRDIRDYYIKTRGYWQL